MRPGKTQLYPGMRLSMLGINRRHCRSSPIVNRQSLIGLTVNSSIVPIGSSHRNRGESSLCRSGHFPKRLMCATVSIRPVASNCDREDLALKSSFVPPGGRTGDSPFAHKPGDFCNSSKKIPGVFFAQPSLTSTRVCGRSWLPFHIFQRAARQVESQRAAASTGNMESGC